METKKQLLTGNEVVIKAALAAQAKAIWLSNYSSHRNND